MQVETIDISGFVKPPRAVGYEGVCQKMLWTGIMYLSKVDTPEEILKGMIEYKNVYGICVLPESAKELEDAVMKAVPDCSGAQHQAVMSHLRRIAKTGLKKFIDEAKKRKHNVYKIDLESVMKKTSEFL